MPAMPLQPKLQADDYRCLRDCCTCRQTSQYVAIGTAFFASTCIIARDQHNLHRLQATPPPANQASIHPIAIALKFVYDPRTRTSYSFFTSLPCKYPRTQAYLGNHQPLRCWGRRLSISIASVLVLLTIEMKWPYSL